MLKKLSYYFLNKNRILEILFSPYKVFCFQYVNLKFLILLIFASKM